MCGIIGIYSTRPEPGIDVPYHAYASLFSLDHRGQEAAGLVTINGEKFCERRKPGSVADVFRLEDKLQGLEGVHAVGHVRYSTAGGKEETSDMQPLMLWRDGKRIAVGHNGNLYNASELRSRLNKGQPFATSSDTEVIIHLAMRSVQPNFGLQLVDALQNVRGAYSLIVVHDNKMYVARDPDGYRPLCHGRKGNCVVFASENVALEDIGATYCGEVPAGKLFTFSQEGFEECSINRSSGASKCIFELIYFAHPSSRIFNMVSDNSAFRQRCGEALWRENPADVDIIFPSPDSGIDAAIGYSRAAGKETSAEYARGLVRSHTVGRTFIMPKEDSRIIGIRRKLKPTGSAVNGKRVLFVDDSIVRGNTSKELVSMLREAGAQEVHVRVASPPIRAPCDMGMDFPTYDELAASGRSVEEVCGMIEADSLEYLSQSGLLACAKELGGEGFCTSCFTGEMPSELVRIRKEKGLYRDPSGLAP